MRCIAGLALFIALYVSSCTILSGAVRRDWPLAAVAVIKPVHEAVVAVAQFEAGATIVEPSSERSEDIGDSGGGLERGRVAGDDEVAAAGDDRAFGEREADATLEGPGRKVDIDGHLVVQLDPLIGGFVGSRVILNFVKDHHGVGAPGVVERASRNREEGEKSLRQDLDGPSRGGEPAARFHEFRCL